MEAISVQQRHARTGKELAQNAANQKRDQHMPYTQEKAARRRAMSTAIISKLLGEYQMSIMSISLILI